MKCEGNLIEVAPLLMCHYTSFPTNLDSLLLSGFLLEMTFNNLVKKGCSFFHPG